MKDFRGGRLRQCDPNPKLYLEVPCVCKSGIVKGNTKGSGTKKVTTNKGEG